jgi:hypothetical protein
MSPEEETLQRLQALVQMPQFGRLRARRVQVASVPDAKASGNVPCIVGLVVLRGGALAACRARHARGAGGLAP